MASSDFSDKLNLVLKAFSLSRGRLAAELKVDKSLVGRWAAGTVTPSAHNLAGLTALISKRLPGFSLLDWDLGIAGLAERLGVDANAIAKATSSEPESPVRLQVSCTASWSTTATIRSCSVS